MLCTWARPGAINGVEQMFRCSLFRGHPPGHKCFLDGMTLLFEHDARYRASDGLSTIVQSKQRQMVTLTIRGS